MKEEEKYNLILADDHILLRDALATLISGFDHFNVLATASNGRELVDCFAKGCRPQLAILDLNMPEMDGYETSRWLQANHPEVRIIILTMYDSEIALIRLLQVGVRGFLKKDVHPGELKNALLSVAENGYYYSHNATGKLASFFQKNHISQTSIEKALLNDKEVEFLKLASTDLTYKEIAQRLKLTPRAIDGYRDSLFEKLEVKSRVGLAIFAVRTGIVTF
ncbi:MAG: response regulator transcription factor [Chitinophagaceae bacterium]|nr:response regulator transcription factor [Chitinophagaceae bacterium]